jgi:DNA invertase Pin-like site-specific DNA recombinase
METAEPQSCVAYYRVSTQRQGRSGLGLEAQQRAVRDHIEKTHRRLIAELVEIESGKNPDRPKLLEALKLCRLGRSKLIVARLDRLARNVAFVSRLMEAGVDFEAADFPQANRFTVHILAAVAEYEARLISERTKAGLAAAKARGVKLGRRFPTPGHPPGLEKARQVSMEKLAARTADLAPVIAEIRAAGFVSAIAVARELTARGIRPMRAAGLTALRTDIACAVLGSGRLSHQSVKYPEPDRSNYNPVDTIPLAAQNKLLRVFLVTDPADTRVPVTEQTPYVDKWRAAGRQIPQFFVEADSDAETIHDMNTHHGVGRYTVRVMAGCVFGQSDADIARSVDALVTRVLAANAAKWTAPTHYTSRNGRGESPSPRAGRQPDVHMAAR